MPPPFVQPTQWGWGWAVAGMFLVAVHAALLVISPQFTYGGLPVLRRPTELIVALMMLGGAGYLAAIWLLKLPERAGFGWWAWVLLVGLAMRALLFPSTPMLETDYYRYLWDGGVLAHGHNPYALAPADVLAGEAPAELVELGEKSGLVLGRVSYPRLTTIYPPTAQALFALGHVLAPWRIEGLRAVWFVLDVAALVLLIGLLRDLRLPTSAAVIYWWNPLLVKEVYNSAHMELVVLPFIVAAVWLTVRSRLLGGVLMLAAAVGGKLWPVLLLPALLHQRGLKWGRLGIAAGVFFLISGFMVWPLLGAGLGKTAGVRAYALTWETNDTLYQGFHAVAAWVLPAASPQAAHRAARLMVGVILLGWIALLCRRPAGDGRAVCKRVLWIIAALFLLSPTQYPWYWLWMLPMLAVRPSPGLLILTATLPLYYLRFPMRELGYSWWFHHGVVWLQFGPAFALLAWEAWRRGSAPAPTVPEVGALHER